MVLLLVRPRPEELVNTESVLDAWTDDHTNTVITLHPFVDERSARGFAARVGSADGTTRWRYFVRTEAGLEVCDGPRARSLLGLPRIAVHRRRRPRNGAAIAAVMAVALMAGCGGGSPLAAADRDAIPSPTADTVASCPDFVPTTLPDGVPPEGDGELVDTDLGPATAWALDDPPGPHADYLGQVLVFHGWAVPESDLSVAEGDLPDGDRSTVRGHPAAIRAVGDPPLGAQHVYWSVGECQYDVMVDAGLTTEQMQDYVTRM